MVEGAEHGDDGAAGVALDRHRVFAAGWLADGEPSGDDLLVRAYDPASGALLWEDRLDSVQGASASVAVRGRRTFVAGAAPDLSQGEPAAQGDTRIQAYELR